MENLKKQTMSIVTATPFLLLLPQILSSQKPTEKFKLIHYLLSLTLYLLRLILSLLPSSLAALTSSFSRHDDTTCYNKKHEIICTQGDSALDRALSQILFTMVDLPVTSRKYDTLRSLADRIIDENHEEGSEAVLEVNRRVMVSAFVTTLGRLEEVMLDEERARVRVGDDQQGLGWVWNAARSRVGLLHHEDIPAPPPVVGGSALKLAAEVLWLARKLLACGYGEEAVSRWGEASGLSWLATSADPSIQGSLLKISAFLFMQAKELGGNTEYDETQREEQIQTRKKLLISWLPLLCCASNGTDSPILSNMEKKELEKVLEHITQMLKQDDEQEQVLSLWLHHFTSSPSSDWPNLQTCYNRWCTSSRKRLAAQ